MSAQHIICVPFGCRVKSYMSKTGLCIPHLLEKIQYHISCSCIMLIVRLAVRVDCFQDIPKWLFQVDIHRKHSPNTDIPPQLYTDKFTPHDWSTWWSTNWLWYWTADGVEDKTQGWTQVLLDETFWQEAFQS